MAGNSARNQTQILRTVQSNDSTLHKTPYCFLSAGATNRPPQRANLPDSSWQLRCTLATDESPTSTVHKSMQHQMQQHQPSQSMQNIANKLEAGGFLRPLPTTTVPAVRLISPVHNYNENQQQQHEQTFRKPELFALPPHTPLPSTPGSVVAPDSKRGEFVWNQWLERATIAHQTYRTLPIVQPKAKVSHDVPAGIVYSKLNIDPTYDLLKARQTKPKSNSKLEQINWETCRQQQPPQVQYATNVDYSSQLPQAFDYRQYIEAQRCNQLNRSG